MLISNFQQAISESEDIDDFLKDLVGVLQQNAVGAPDRTDHTSQARALWSCLLMTTWMPCRCS